MAKSRPQVNASPLPMAATRAVAVSAPMPGISKSRRVVSSWCAISFLAKGKAQVVRALPELLADEKNGLSPR